MKNDIRTYSELIKIDSFDDRLEYLSLNGIVGETTFAGHRYLNQMLYKMQEWKIARREVIIRDNGFDLAHPDYPIGGKIYVHHIKPITIDDILQMKSWIFDPEYLISASLNTHNAIHYGYKDLRIEKVVTRKPNDTIPWRR